MLVPASDPAAGWGGGGQETWNLCDCLWQPSFLWLISTGGGAMAPSAPPGSATARSCRVLRRPRILCWFHCSYTLLSNFIDARKPVNLCVTNRNLPIQVAMSKRNVRFNPENNVPVTGDANNKSRKPLFYKRFIPLNDTNLFIRSHWR